MSISSMANARVTGRRDATPDAGTVRLKTKDGEEEPVPLAPAGFLTQLAHFIPTETLTLYVAVLAALGPLKVVGETPLDQLDYTSRWGWAIAGMAVSALLAIAICVIQAKKAKVPVGVPIFEPFAAALAFAGWSLALPETPLNSYDWYSPEWGAVLVIAVTIAVTVIGALFGKTPTYEPLIPQGSSS